jgi:AcrR family transcriptional regulator
MSTSGIILETALELFSKRGYTAVSIRDICKEVGIKESTIYYHFKNKQDILDSLTARFQERTQKLVNPFEQEMFSINGILDEGFIRVGLIFIEDYLMDSFINPFIRILLIEQGTNESLAALYRQLLFENPIEVQSRIFEYLIEIGYFKKSTADFFLLRTIPPSSFFCTNIC